MPREVIERNVSEQSAPALSDLVGDIAQLFQAGFEVDEIEIDYDEDGDPVLRCTMTR